MIKQAGAQGREHGTNVPENLPNPASQTLFHEAWALIPVKQMNCTGSMGLDQEETRTPTGPILHIPRDLMRSEIDCIAFACLQFNPEG